MQKLVLILITAVMFSFNAFSEEVILSVTDNDENVEIYKLIVNVDKTTQSLKEFYKDTYLDGVKIKRQVLDTKLLNTDSGVIMEERDGYNVLNLKSDNFDHARGGRVVIDSLFSGFTGERREYDLELAKDKTGWKLFSNKKIVSKFHIIVNRSILLGIIGIKTINME